MRFLGVVVPSEVDVDGQAASGWSYDAATRTLTVPLPDRAISARTAITVR